MMKRLFTITAMFAVCLGTAAQSGEWERLDRGFAGVTCPEGFHLSWRAFPSDKADASYDIFRSTDGGKYLKINDKAIRSTSDFIDVSADFSKDNLWVLKSGGKTLASFCCKAGEAFPYIEIPVSKPASREIFRITQRFYGTTDQYNPGDESDLYNYTAGDCSVGDLDGDGQLEIVLKWDPSNASVPERTGVTGNTVFDAYKLDGTLLWRIDLGHNVRSTYATVPFVVYDLDGDGSAEFVCKTADASVDGCGNIIGNYRADWRSMDESSATFGRIAIGPEYLTVFDGRSGKALDSQKFIPIRFPLDSWGGIGGNDDVDIRPEKYTAGVAYLDGRTPSVFFVRGADGKTVVAAWSFRDGKLENLWKFDSSEAEWNGYSGNGNPNVAVADFDSDGADEICVGAMVVDNDGRGLTTTRLRGGVALHTGKFIPSRDGLQVFGIHDTGGQIGAFLGNPAMALYDGATGEIIWSKGPYETVGRGVAADIDPRYEGAEMWVGAVDTEPSRGGRMGAPAPGGPAPGGQAFGGPIPGGPTPGGQAFGGPVPVTPVVGPIPGGDRRMMASARAVSPEYNGALKGLYNGTTGELISNSAPSSCNFTLFWDADAQSELLDGTTISKWNWEQNSTDILYKAEGVKSINSSKSVPCLSGDILGDWREEVVWINADETALRIYMTPVPASNRIPTLLSDRQYRLSLVWQNAGHNQPPHTSFDMQTTFRF